MTPDRETALRDLLTALADDLAVPRPVSPADDDRQLALFIYRATTARYAIKHLLDGPLDNVAVHAEARSLREVTGCFPADYPALTS